MTSPTDRRTALAVFVAGVGLFVLALAAARTTLPEWRAGRLPAPERFRADLRQIASAAGVELGSEDANVELSRGFEPGPASPYPALGAATDDWLLDQRRPLFVEAFGVGTTTDGLPVYLVANLGIDGRPWNLSFSRTTLAGMFTPRWDVALPTPESVLLRDGERLGEPRNGIYNGNSARMYPIEGGAGGIPEYLAETALENAPATFVARGVGDLDAVASGGGAWLARVLATASAKVLLFAGGVLIAFVLALRRRIDFVNAIVLAALATGVSAVAALATRPISVLWVLLETGIKVALSGVFVLVLWATAESLLRDVGAEPTNALDLLRRGRIDRRVGRAVWWGLGIGAAAAAVSLVAHMLPHLGGVFTAAFRPEHATLALPPFDPAETPFDLGTKLAGATLLMLALARRLVPRRWAMPLALALGSLIRLAGSQDFSSLWAELVVAVAVVGLLLAAFRWAGSLATLVAGVATFLIPATVFSALHANWLGGQLAAASLILLGLGAVGIFGLARSEAEPLEVEAPAFVARIEEERRVRYEMDLLARMQLGLLPEALPRVAGWEVAARSMLAHEVGGDFYDFLRDEAGGLWIAAGDVAGHGSSCSISHAMAKAALASLVVAERTPGQVLDEADRVLRRLGTRRVFTSLALLRIDTVSGRALFANAGYPYPLIRGNGLAGEASGAGVREVALPGLPLGQGPARRYTDVALDLTPGEVLLLSSDGLFEAHGADGRPYGYERVRTDLPDLPATSAQALLDALLAHWRRTVGAGPLEDDTTVVVVRRDA